MRAHQKIKLASRMCWESRLAAWLFPMPENFSVDYYGDYTLLKTKDGTQILTVPEDKDIPDNLDEDIVVLKQPVDGIYLVSSAVMDMFRELGALDCIPIFWPEGRKLVY